MSFYDKNHRFMFELAMCECRAASLCKISVDDGLPKFVYILCLVTIKEVMLFLRKVHKGSLALTHLKQEIEKNNSGPNLLMGDVLHLQRNIDTQDEVIGGQTSEHSSAADGRAFSGAELITSDLFTPRIAVKEEPQDELTDPPECKYSARAVVLHPRTLKQSRQI